MSFPIRHPVGAGHARPATLPLYPFHLNPVGEGFIPPVYPTPSPTKRFARADASIRPYNLCPSNNKSPTCTLPKNPPRNLSKKPKKPIDKSMTTCYNNQAVPRRRPRQALLPTACARFLKKTSSKNFQKTLDNQADLIYNIQAISESRQHSRTLKIEQN